MKSKFKFSLCCFFLSLSLSPSPIPSLALSVTLSVYHFLASSARGAYSISPSKQTDMFCLVKCALPLPLRGLGTVAAEEQVAVVKCDMFTAH